MKLLRQDMYVRFYYCICLENIFFLLTVNEDWSNRSTQSIDTFPSTGRRGEPGMGPGPEFFCIAKKTAKPNTKFLQPLRLHVCLYLS